MEEAFIKCDVAKGIFADEREVTLNTREGGKITLLTNKAFVRSAGIVGDTPVEGKLKVFIVHRENDEALVRLPSQAYPGANNVWVMRKDIEG